MPSSDREDPDLYRRLINTGITPEEIEKLYQSLRGKGYGEEEARRRSAAIIARVRSRRDAERRRTAQRKPAPVGQLVSNGFAATAKAAAPKETMGAAPESKRRAADWLPPLSPGMRRRINRWAFSRGLRATRFPEIVNDILGVFNKGRKDYVSRAFLRLLADHKGYMAANPFEFCLIDAMDALRDTARRLLGGGRPVRRIAEREKAGTIEQEVRRSLTHREPFALEFLGLFSAPNEMLLRGLSYIQASLVSGARLEIPAVARVVKEAYRLILITEHISTDTLDHLFDVIKEVNLVHDRRPGALSELWDAESLFRAAFQRLQSLKTELYPVLLKMIAAFYEPETDSPEKKLRICAILDLSDQSILTYEGYQNRLAKAREEVLKEQKQRELERLEQEKQEMFSYRFQGTLGTLAALFPDSGIERIEQGEFIVPYFANRVFSRHPVLSRRIGDMEHLSASDVTGMVMIVHMIIDDLLDSLDVYALERVLARERLGTELADVREQWKSAYDRLFEPYLDEIREWAMETSGDPRYVRIFRDSLRARTIEERATRLRNNIMKNYGRITLGRDVTDAPRLFELAEQLGALLADIGEWINPELVDAENPVKKRLAEDLASVPVVDFEQRSLVGSEDYRPVTRQIRRLIEARYRRTPAQAPVLAQAVFFDIFRAVADLYLYLLSDRKSFVTQARRHAVVAGDEEKKAWLNEKQARGRDALLLQTRLTEELAVQYADELTGMKNKNFFLTELGDRIDGLRAKGKPVTFLLIDIDHFKWVNDELGHQNGDEVLSETAAMIRDNIREGDVAIRYGGEEILVVIPSDLHTGIMLAERLRFTQEQGLGLKSAYIGIKQISEERREPCGTLSVGVAETTRVGKLSDAVQLADRALYAAKKMRNTVVILDPKRQGPEPFVTYAEYRDASQRKGPRTTEQSKAV